VSNKPGKQLNKTEHFTINIMLAPIIVPACKRMEAKISAFVASISQ
jgi:hypothetical protein